MDLHPIENKVLSSLKFSIRNSQPESALERTRAIKRAFVVLGHKLRYKVCTSGPKKLGADQGEWLFDVSWADWSHSWRDLRGLKLISEIEWQNDEDNILSDFRKLTVGIAEFRVLITSYKVGKKYERRLFQMVKVCKSICPGSRGFRYLIIAIPNKYPARVKTFAWTI